MYLQYDLFVFCYQTEEPNSFFFSLLTDLFSPTRAFPVAFPSLQVWAADDYEIFKRMMIQKNIELQLQALELLQQKWEREKSAARENSNLQDVF